MKSFKEGGVRQEFALTTRAPFSHAGPEAVEAVKQRLAKERDLEGIDVSNIVSGPRRRREAAAPTRSYAYT